MRYTRIAKRSIAVLLSLGAFSLSGLAWQTSNVGGDQESGYHMRVVSRSTQAVDYRRKGNTKVDLKGTDLMPSADGEAKVESRSGRIQINAELSHVRPANNFGLAYMTYVLWAITPEGRPRNLGEFLLHDEKGSLQVTTDLQAFGLVVTAEPYYAVSQPSDLVVAQNVIRRDTAGKVEAIDVRYELVPRDIYTSQVAPLPEPIYGVNNKIPLDLLEARNSVRIAKDAQADKYASATFQKAQADLDKAEDYYRRKQGVGPIGTVAREATQTAEEARLMTVKAIQDQRAQADREAARKRAEDAEATAEAQRRAADEQQAGANRAQAEAAQAQAQQQAEAQQRQAAEQAQQQAEQARKQAEVAQQQANQQAQAAEQGRQQAVAEKNQMRARLLQQLNQVLQTRDTARGLIVSMPDVLFDTGKAELKPTARERLARVGGILLAYPDIRVEIDGYTDSTGSQEFNQKLSMQRAGSVESYLGQQGVAGTSMTAQGFGPTDPIASNDTAAGRQQNRRVELVVSGESIGGAATQSGQTAPDQSVAPGQTAMPGQSSPQQTPMPAPNTAPDQR
ncbi:MAG: OmpA/MotB domain protein [Acidobacteriaceae bacterium]|jgi:outer membrane protein OmpA-like peptidoglycan-associated protein|nr:OmpA/MotB domain protein [Acidobacteriaceae bacterium]